MKNVLISPHAGKAIDLDANPTGWVDILAAGRQAWTHQRAYRKLDIYHRCVEIVGGTVSNIPWEIVSSRTDEPVWAKDGRPPDDLAWLGDMGIHVWLAATSIALEKAAYFYKERPRIGRGYERLRWLNPLNITPEIDGKAGIAHFVRHVNGKREQLEPEDMIYLFGLDPYVEIGPSDTSDGEAARASAEVLMAMDTFLQGHFENGLIKTTLLRIHEDAQPDEVARVQTWWQKFMAGVRNAGRLKVIQSGGLEPVTIGDGLKELSNTELTKDMTQKVAAAFGVPVSMLDNSAANLATAREYTMMFYQGVAIPRANRIAMAFNKHLFNDLGYHLRFRPERLELFQTQELSKAQSISQLVGGPVMTVNEGRAKLEMESVPWGDEPPRGFGGDGAPVEPPDAIEEAKAWRRKIKAKGRDVEFSPDAMTLEQHAAIKARLDAGWDLDRAFAPPFRNF